MWGYHGISGLFLPYDLARTHAEILSATPEELQEITEEDAMAEGIQAFEYIDACNGVAYQMYGTERLNPGIMSFTAIEAFRKLWDSIYGESYPWAGNWWVWAYDYKRVEKPNA